MVLDDRNPDGSDLCWQLYDELKRVSLYYLDLAQRVELANIKAEEARKAVAHA